MRIPARRLAIAVPLLAVVFVVSLTSQRQARIDPAAVSFVLTRGGQLGLADFRGRPLLISFWASDCPACLREMPELGELYHELSPAGLGMIGVAMPHDPPARILEVQQRLDPPYPLAFDLESRVTRAFGDVRVTPTHVLVGPAGDIVFRHTGALDMAQTRSLILDLLPRT